MKLRSQCSAELSFENDIKLKQFEFLNIGKYLVNVYT